MTEPQDIEAPEPPLGRGWIVAGVVATLIGLLCGVVMSWVSLR